MWMPVEVPGAAYQVLATEGISSIFDPLGITYEVFDAGYDPAPVAVQHDRLPDRRTRTTWTPSSASATS